MSTELKTKLKFEPSRLSSTILKKYLTMMIKQVTTELITKLINIPHVYNDNPDTISNFKALKELCEMSIFDWKKIFQDTNSIENLYIHDDMVVQDSKYYYDSWKIIQDEVGNYEEQMNFFRLLSDIVAELNSRSFVEVVSAEGHVKNHDSDSLMRGQPYSDQDTDLFMNNIDDD